MENLVDVLNKKDEYELFIDLLPEVIQEVSLAGHIGEDGDWHKMEWKQDIVWILSSVRLSFQELVEMIKSEKSRIKS